MPLRDYLKTEDDMISTTSLSPPEVEVGGKGRKSLTPVLLERGGL
jgi:hypothetical protein